MKRKWVLLIIFIIVICAGLTYVFASEGAKFSSAFIRNFKNCNSFEETSQSVFEGQTFKTERKIHGWNNGFCMYSETIFSKNEAYNLNCNFAQIQVEELYNSMKNRSKEQKEYALDVYGLKKDPHTGKESYSVVNKISITGDNAEIAWARYENNPYFCSPQKLK